MVCYGKLLSFKNVSNWKNDICYFHNNHYQYRLISMTISMNEKIKAVN